MYVILYNTKKVNRKALKSIKGYKQKNGLSLVEANRIIKEIHNNVSENTNLGYTLVDTENELEYSFEDLTINPNEISPSIMEILEEEIINSGHEKGQRILSELEMQYQAEEKNVSETQIEPPKAQNTKNKKSLFSQITNRFSKNTLKKQEKESVENDFAELEEDLSSEFDTSDYSDDFKEVSHSNDYEDVSEKQNQTPNYNIDSQNDNQDFQASFDESEDNYTESNLNTENSTEIDNNYDSTESLNIESTNDSPNNDDYVISDTYEEEKRENVETSQYQNKHERVIFPPYNSYLDLSAIKSFTDRNKARFETDRLLTLLGLTNVRTKLDSKKYDYSIRALEDSEFVLLTDYLHTSIDDIKDKTETNLALAYEKALAIDYEELASKEQETVIQSLLEEAEGEYLDYAKEQADEFNLKLEKFENEQKKALEDFIRNQELEKNIYVQEMDSKKNARLTLYKDNTQESINVKKQQLIDDKMYELKNIGLNNLQEEKRKAIRNFETQVDSAVDDIWENTVNAINKLKKDIDTHIPEWKKEIEEQDLAEANLRAEKRKDVDLELRKEEIEIQRAKLKNENTEANQEEVENISKIVERKMTEFDQQVLSKLEQIGNQDIVKESKAEVSKKPPMSNFKTVGLAIGASIALILGGSVLGSYVVGNRPVESETAYAQEDTMYYQLLQTVEELKEESESTEGNSEETNQEETLEYLLENKLYDRAMAVYKEPSDLKIIEDTLYENGDLASLITFNKMFNVSYGTLTESLMSGETDNVIALTKEMKIEDLISLGEKQKSDLAVTLYQNNEKELADKILSEDQ